MVPVQATKDQAHPPFVHWNCTLVSMPAREDQNWSIFRHSNLHLSIIKLSPLGTQGVVARDVPLLHLLKNTTICFTDQKSDSIGQFLVWDRRMVMCAEFCNLATDLKITQKFYSSLAKGGWLWQAQSGSWGRTAPKHSDTSCIGCNTTWYGLKSKTIRAWENKIRRQGNSSEHF